MAWFEGSREGAKDVQINMSRYSDGSWSKPRSIADRKETARDTGRYIRKLGNPVLGVDRSGQVHLWYVTVSIGGWATSSITHRLSSDDGYSWQKSERLITAPFLNISTLVRNKPVFFRNGTIGLPTYHELATKHGEFLHLHSDGVRVIQKTRIPASRPLLQPALIVTDNGNLLALMRDGGSAPGHIWMSQSGTRGTSWQPASALPIANPNSAIDALRLTTGELILAANPGTDRSQLALFISHDEGGSWTQKIMIENEPLSEFSYPTLLQTHDGLIHLAYTWKRQSIKHLVIAPYQLLGEADQ